jgi:hypothetical protein
MEDDELLDAPGTALFLSLLLPSCRPDGWIEYMSTVRERYGANDVVQLLLLAVVTLTLETEALSFSEMRALRSEQLTLALLRYKFPDERARKSAQVRMAQILKKIPAT